MLLHVFACFKWTIVLLFRLVFAFVVHSNASIGDLFVRFLCIFCSIGFALLTMRF